VKFEGVFIMKKRFGIDIDGTVTSPSAILPFINRAFGLNITLADVKQYDLNPVVNVSEQEFANWWLENEPIIYAKSPIADGAASVLNQWKNKFELCFISARGPQMLEITKQWFSEHNLKPDQIELIGTHDKVEAAKKHKVDLFLEDKHDNAIMIHEECKIPVLLFDTPYNQEPIPQGVFRIYTWKEACNWVETWSREKRLG
jgi:uncharacterized HAD superfamily protein